MGVRPQGGDKVADLVESVVRWRRNEWLAVDKREDAAMEKVGDDRGGACHQIGKFEGTGLDVLLFRPRIVISHTNQSDTLTLRPLRHVRYEPVGKTVAIDNGVAVVSFGAIRHKVGELQNWVEHQWRPAPERGGHDVL